MPKRELPLLLNEFNSLGIAEQIDYKKFYLYSIITHSTAIEGSTVTEIENRLLFDEGITAAKRSLSEQLMNIDLKAAYERAIELAKSDVAFSVQMLKELSALVMKNMGARYNSISGKFDSSKGDLRLVNVSAGAGGKSYMAFQKVPDKLEEFCAWLNSSLGSLDKGDLYNSYELSFAAHYRLVTIHPWVDGNGRMSRLIMNLVQMRLGLLPTIVLKEHKSDYIAALEKSSQNDGASFCDFMFGELIQFLQNTINEFKKSMEN